MIIWHSEVEFCPHCESEDFSDSGTTNLGYPRYLCYECKCTFNERSKTSYNRLEYPTDVVMQVVRWHVSHELSFRDLSQMFLERGLSFTPQSAHGWVLRFRSVVSKEPNYRAFGNGERWIVKVTPLRKRAEDCYLYRAYDHSGILIDCMLSKTKDRISAKKFFERTKYVVGSMQRWA
jgi:putative transposase